MRNEPGISIRFTVAIAALVAVIATACGQASDDATNEEVSPGATSGIAEEGNGSDEDGRESPPSQADAGTTEEEAGDRALAIEGDTAGGGASALDEMVQSDDGIVEPPIAPPRDGGSGNVFEDYGIRPFVETAVDPLSTFSLDVDTASYTVARRWLDDGRLPPPESVRVEEYVNAFDYGYDDPRAALGIEVDGGPSPFDDGRHVLRVGVQSDRLGDDRPAAALTFVIDTSGSMEKGGRLEIVKDALEELVEALDASDTVAIVEFDDDPSVVLEPTAAADAAEILDAVESLRPGGSTNVEAGLALGYGLADEAFDRDRVNRVILLSDGVANRGLTDPDGLARMIREDADRGIHLLTVGVGMGNFNDVLLEQLADQGDGFYAYVDSNREAERLFRDELTATLVTIAVDAKIQLEFDEEVVRSYRLIGYENRGVLDDDFRNDEVDAGEIGAGHQATAVYEVELHDDLDPGDTAQLGTVQLRWEDPGSGEVNEIAQRVGLHSIESSWAATNDSFKLAVLVTAFAEVLRHSPFSADIDLDDLEDEVEDLAERTGRGDIEELAELVETADRLTETR